MKLGEIKAVLQKVQAILQSIHPKAEKSYLYENYDDGSSVTWRFANVTSPQQIQSNVETAAIWLWSLKDYLKARLTYVNRNPQVVETYVNNSRYLPILADIANGVKHGNLNASRSGRFASIDECIIKMSTKSWTEAVPDGDADIQLIVEDPSLVSYKIRINDNNGRYMGDAIVLLKNAMREWKRFIRTEPDLKPLL